VDIQLCLFSASALKGNEWSALCPSHFSRQTAPGNASNSRLAGWAPKPNWKLWRREKFLDPAWN